MGVHFIHRWSKQQVTACLQECFLIGSEGARVGVEVFVGPKLQRVNENARDHEIGLLRRLADQRGMAAVQVTHSRYQADLFAFATCAGDGCAQLANGFYCVHAENPCSVPGKLTALTSVT